MSFSSTDQEIFILVKTFIHRNAKDFDMIISDIHDNLSPAKQYFAQAYIDYSAQGGVNYIANKLGLLQSCTKPSICISISSLP